jgi:hypothetical protein
MNRGYSMPKVLTKEGAWCITLCDTCGKGGQLNKLLTTWYRIRRRVLNARRWLYRDAWKSAVLVLLILSLCEPLLCLLHCHLMTMGTAHAHTAAAHDHTGHRMQAGHVHAPPAADALVAGEHSAHVGCRLHDIASSSALGLVASSTHDHLAVSPLLTLLLIVLQPIGTLFSTSRGPPSPPIYRLLRPPQAA